MCVFGDGSLGEGHLMGFPLNGGFSFYRRWQESIRNGLQMEVYCWMEMNKKSTQDCPISILKHPQKQG